MAELMMDPSLSGVRLDAMFGGEGWLCVRNGGDGFFFSQFPKYVEERKGLEFLKPGIFPTTSFPSASFSLGVLFPPLTFLIHNLSQFSCIRGNYDGYKSFILLTPELFFLFLFLSFS